MHGGAYALHVRVHDSTDDLQWAVLHIAVASSLCESECSACPIQPCSTDSEQLTSSYTGRHDHHESSCPRHLRCGLKRHNTM
jgi:hypothetical protein